MRDYPELLTVPEAARVLRISRNMAYELIARGQLPAIRLGRVIRIPGAVLERWIEQATKPGIVDRDAPDGALRSLHGRYTGAGR